MRAPELWESKDDFFHSLNQRTDPKAAPSRLDLVQFSSMNSHDSLRLLLYDCKSLLVEVRQFACHDDCIPSICGHNLCDMTRHKTISCNATTCNLLMKESEVQDLKVVHLWDIVSRMVSCCSTSKL